MEAADFDEIAFLRSIQASGARALLIGRRALVLLGLPVLTADYDFRVILTKRIAPRPKDLADIRLLDLLRQEEES